MSVSPEALNYAIAFKQESEGLQRAYITVPYSEIPTDDITGFINELKMAFKQVFPFDEIEIHDGIDNFLIAK